MTSAAASVKRNPSPSACATRRSTSETVGAAACAGRRRRGALGVAVLSAVVCTWYGSAAAVELPKRKPGLWEVRTTGGPMGAQTMQQCVDAKTDDLVGSKGDADQDCTEPVITRKGSRYTFQLICKSEGVTSRVDGNYVMAQDTAYSGETKMTFTPPQAGMSGMDLKIDGKWLGPCKAGMKPGDIVMQGMPNFNLQQQGKDGGGMDPEQMRRMLEEMRKNLPKRQ